jgi:hypothetical protein
MNMTLANLTRFERAIDRTGMVGLLVLGATVALAFIAV